MADFSTLIATLQATIKTNYNQEITGSILQGDLLAIVDAVNRLKQDTLEGYAFYGAPLADGASVSVTQNTFFLVAEGEYEINGSTIEVDAAGVSVIVYDSVNNTTNWYTLFAYDTTPTENSRNAITSGAVAAALAPLATKEDVEAVEQEVAQVAGEAGLAEAVIDTDGAGTEQEFTFRKSGGDGGAYYRKIKGKTIAWNQLVRNGNFEDATGWLFDGNGSVANNEATVVSTAGIAGAYRSDISIISGHYYFVSCYVKVSEIKPIRLYLGTNDSDGVTVTPSNTNQYVLLYGIEQASMDTFIIQCNSILSVGETITIQKVRATDLTLAGLADLTAAQFEALYPDIYPYNPDTLISNDAEAVETTGVNQWDEETEVVGSQLQSKNLIPVFPNTAYYITMLSYPSHYHNKIFYNAEGEEIGLDASDAQSFITPADCAYMRTILNSGYGTTYNHDICINLSNPAINGQYFPYWKRTLQLGITTKKDTDGNVPFPNGLQSCPVAQDEATKEGGTIRVGTRAYQAGDESDANVITDGTNTNYALATPVPFTWAEPLNLGVKVDEGGTERAVAPEGATAPSAPFVADTTYTMSVARMVEKLQNL